MIQDLQDQIENLIDGKLDTMLDAELLPHLEELRNSIPTRGSCALLSFLLTYVLSHFPEAEPRLVHAIIRMAKCDNEPGFHAWVEMDNCIIDLTNLRDYWVMPIVGGMEPIIESKSYTPDVLSQMGITDSCGPWESPFVEQLNKDVKNG